MASLVLLVEDNIDRGNEILQVIPKELHCVWAKSAGAAIGILRRDQFIAILLDWDLGSSGNGESVAEIVCETQKRDCEVLVHSSSAAGARKIATTLKGAGFDVETRAWSQANASYFHLWLQRLIEDPS